MDFPMSNLLFIFVLTKNKRYMKKTTLTTLVHKTIDKHIITKGGHKTVCVTTCLNFIGVPFDSYNFTSTNKNTHAWKGVVRRNGFRLRSRKSELGAMRYPTMTELKRNLKKSGYSERDYFLVSGVQSTTAHLMVLDGLGNTVVDTAPGKKWRITNVLLVEKD